MIKEPDIKQDKHYEEVSSVLEWLKKWCNLECDGCQGVKACHRWWDWHVAQDITREPAPQYRPEFGRVVAARYQLRRGR